MNFIIFLFYKHTQAEINLQNVAYSFTIRVEPTTTKTNSRRTYIVFFLIYFSNTIHVFNKHKYVWTLDCVFFQLHVTSTIRSAVRIKYTTQRENVFFYCQSSTINCFACFSLPVAFEQTRVHRAYHIIHSVVYDTNLSYFRFMHKVSTRKVTKSIDNIE